VARAQTPAAHPAIRRRRVALEATVVKAAQSSIPEA